MSTPQDLPETTMAAEAILTFDAQQSLDARGLRCPMPLLKAKLALNSMMPNEVLRVLATDGGSVKDFHAFANLVGHQMIGFAQQQNEFLYLLKKGQAS